MTAPSILKGRTWVWPDDVNTDIIIPFRFKARTNDPVEMAKYCSSREQAPVAIKYSNVSAVVAESFARIFYRNCFAIGLPALEIPGISKQVKQFDEIEVNLQDWSVKTRGGSVYPALKVPEFLRSLMREGGLVEYYKHHGSFPWEKLEAASITS